MGLKQLFAARTKRKLRFAVLRPHLDRLPALRERLQKSYTPEEFQDIANEALASGAKVMGFAKPGCSDLFDREGFRTGEKTQPGDIYDLIEDFDRAIATGGYQKMDPPADTNHEARN